MLIGHAIKKSFNGKEVLRGVDIEVRPGRISVLIGPSGSGKTTLVKALAHLDYPTGGEIIYDDHEYSFPLSPDVKVIPPWPELTVVFQQHFLWPHLTLRQNIKLPLLSLDKPENKIEYLIRLFKMEHCIDRYPNQVSTGERQRAALARAFALEPKYILLDEITSALDVEQTGAVIRHLLILRHSGIGLLVVTHLLDFARQLVSRYEGDMVYFLDEGKIAGSGGRGFFENPDTSRAKQFLSSMDFWAENNHPQSKGEGDLST